MGLNYLEKLMDQISTCMDLYINNDETLNLFAEMMDNIVEYEVDPDCDLFKYSYYWLNKLCKYNLFPIEFKEFKKYLKVGNGKQELGYIGNRILKFQKIKGVCNLLSDCAIEKILRFYYNGRDISVSDMNRLCNEVVGDVMGCDIKNLNVDDIVYENKKRLYNFEFDRMYNEVNCLSKREKDNIKDIINRFLRLNRFNSLNIFQKIVDGFINICLMGIGLPYDIVDLFDNFIETFNYKEYNNEINLFFNDLKNIIILEDLPAIGQYESTPREFREIISRNKAFKDEDLELDNVKRRVRTIRRFDPIPIPEIGRRRIYNDNELRRVKDMRELIGFVSNPITHGGSRILVRARSGENPSWTGYFHPFIFENDEYFECGMGCNPDRTVEENEKIRDSCIVQINRRFEKTGNVSQVLKDSINRCDNIINGRRSRKRSRKRGRGGRGGTNFALSQNIKRVRRFRSNKVKDKR